ncbi:hypothetical protein [Haematomicrobium sanguinis]|uniref:hypothetical protein n=1 Tax=Haematomicrobium sanguinis TaxID=479106 RepID=UPI00047E2DAD|nr:hypothetical protein [Haematomicrobium sanguinis]
MIPSTWIAHTRPSDRERVGYIEFLPGDRFAAFDLLGRPVAEFDDYLDAEEALENLGIGYLAQVWLYRAEPGADPAPVRILDVSPGRALITTDLYGVIGSSGVETEIPVPVPVGALTERTA